MSISSISSKKKVKNDDCNSEEETIKKTLELIKVRIDDR